MHRNLMLRAFAAATIFVGMVLAGAAAYADRDASEELRKMFGMGVHHYNAGQFVKAYESLTRCIDGKTKDPSVYYYRGLALMHLGREEDAADDFQRGAEMEIRSPKSQSQVGYDLMNVQGRLRLKLEEYRTDAKLAAYQYHVNKEDILRQNQGQALGGAVYGGGYGEQFAPPGSSAVDTGILDVGDYDGLDSDQTTPETGEAEPLDLGGGLGFGEEEEGDTLGGGLGFGEEEEGDTLGGGLGFGEEEEGDTLGGGLGFGEEEEGDTLGGGLGFGEEEEGDTLGGGLGFGEEEEGDTLDGGLGFGEEEEGDTLGGGLGFGEEEEGDTLGGGLGFGEEEETPLTPVKKDTTKKPAAALDGDDVDGEEFNANGADPFNLDAEEEGGGLDAGGAEEPEEPEEADDLLL